MIKRKILIITPILLAGLVFSSIATNALGRRELNASPDNADISRFLNGNGTMVFNLFEREDEVTKDYTYIDRRDELKTYMKSMTIKEDDNHFPYTYRDNACYSYLRIIGNGLIGRVNEEMTSLSLEWRPDDENNIFSIVKYYVIDQTEASHIRDIIETEGTLE